MPPNGRIKLIVYLLVWPIGFLAAIFVFVGLLTPLDALVTVRAAAVAAETGASLIHVDAGLSALVMVFGLVALMGWVRAAMLARRRTNGFPTGAAAMLNPPPALLPPHLRWVLWVWLLVIGGIFLYHSGVATVAAVTR